MFASKMEAKASAASQDWSPPGANIGTNFRGQCGHISWTLFTYTRSSSCAGNRRPRWLPWSTVIGDTEPIQYPGFSITQTLGAVQRVGGLITGTVDSVDRPPETVDHSVDRPPETVDHSVDREDDHSVDREVDHSVDHSGKTLIPRDDRLRKIDKSVDRPLRTVDPVGRPSN